MYYKGRVADPSKVAGLTSPNEDRGGVYTGCNQEKNLRTGVEVKRKLVSMDGEKMFIKRFKLSIFNTCLQA